MEFLRGPPTNRFGEAGNGRPAAAPDRIAERRRPATLRPRQHDRLARFRNGSRIDVPEPYRRATWELFGEVAADDCDAVPAKIP